MNRKPENGANLRPNLDPTNRVDLLRKQDGGHCTGNPLRAIRIHLPNQLAPKMDGAESRDLQPARALMSTRASGS